MQNAVNPKFIPRQHLLQYAIEGAEKGDFSEVGCAMHPISLVFAGLIY